jgi:hypothetical protein
MTLRSLIIILSITTGMSCNPSKKIAKPVDTAKANPLNIPEIVLPDGTKNDIFMEKMLNQHPKYFADILQNRKEYNVQVIYTEINRDADNKPGFTDHFFNVNANRYFYPASTIKLPILLLALEKLNLRNLPGLNRSTTMLTDVSFSGQSEVLNDPTSPDGRPSIGQYVKKILLTSDNDASNRLYEFLGQEYLNEQLVRKGYTSTDIRHRVNIFLTEEENRNTNPIRFVDEQNKLILAQPAAYNRKRFAIRNDSIGKGYMKGGVLINQPMNFSTKNRISIEDLHMILRSVIFPEAVLEKQRFKLNPDDRRFVLQYMSQYPRETLYPAYNPKEYPDNYSKYLIPVDASENIPKHIRIFNKPGNAYGTMLDVAYIVDLEKNVEFFLSTIIYANRDGILNDNKYDYDNLALPFMKNLANVIYQHELNRARKHKPNLDEFRIVYDK